MPNVSNAPQDWQNLADSVGGWAQLAYLLGVSYSTVARWSRRKSRMSVADRALVEKLCQEFRVKVPK